jgi:hypothetical protein
MTKTETILQAGRQIAAIAGGRAFKGEVIKSHAEDALNDPVAESRTSWRLGKGASRERRTAGSWQPK